MDRRRILIRTLFAAYLVAVHALLGYLIVDYLKRSRLGMENVENVPPAGQEITPPANLTEATPVATTPPSHEVFATATPPVTQTSSEMTLIVPVAGVTRESLADNFTQSRGEGRTHDAIDIPAPAGTPVLAAIDGPIARFFDSVPGGITIYQASDDGKFMYYYAHLQRRADGIKPGDRVTRGTVIGYVGDTGNAGAGNYHLHFSISRVADPKRFWEGNYLNPYPYLISGRAPE